MPETATAQTSTHRPRTKFVTDAFGNTIDAAKAIGKRSSDAAEEFMDDNVQRIKRHPIETVVTAFAAGFLLGGLLCWMSKQR